MKLETRKLVTQLRTHFRIWRQAFRSISDPEIYVLASGYAFFVLFSIFPLILLIIVIGSLWLEPSAIESELVNQIEFIAPAFSELLSPNLDQLLRARGSISGVALLSLLWSSSTMFTMFSRMLDQIFYGEQTRSVWRHRGAAILVTLIITTLLMAISLGGSTSIAFVNRFVPGPGMLASEYVGQIATFLLGCVMFGLLYRYLPYTRTPWRVVIPGALAAGVLWDISKRIFLFYITNFLSLSNLVYGPLTAVIAFLTWEYVTGLIFFFGAFLIAAYWHHHEQTNGHADPPIADPDHRHP